MSASGDSTSVILARFQQFEETFGRMFSDFIHQIDSRISQTQKQHQTSTVAAAAAASSRKTDKIPLPWVGTYDADLCHGLRSQYGLFIQCDKKQSSSSSTFCDDCVSKMSASESNAHPIGTVQMRAACELGKYHVNGKCEAKYIDVLATMKIDVRTALEYAASRNVVIPSWMLEKTQKKKGRPSTKNNGFINIVSTSDTPTQSSPASSTSSASVTGNRNRVRGRPRQTEHIEDASHDSMNSMIHTATEARKKRLSLDPPSPSPKSPQQQIQITEDEIFEMFDYVETDASAANKEPKTKKPKEPKLKEPKLKEPKEPKTKEPKEPKTKEPKEPKEPKTKEPKEPKTKEPKEPKESNLKEPKESKTKESKESKLKESKEPNKTKKPIALMSFEKLNSALHAHALTPIDEELSEELIVEDDADTVIESSSDTEEEEEVNCESVFVDGVEYGKSSDGVVYTMDGDEVGMWVCDEMSPNGTGYIEYNKR
jgi:hypothetical protein